MVAGSPRSTESPGSAAFRSRRRRTLCLTHLPTAITLPITPLPIPGTPPVRRLTAVLSTVPLLGIPRMEPHLAALHEASSSAWTARDPGPPPPAPSLTRARTRRSWLWAHGSCLSQTGQVPAGRCYSLPGRFLPLPAGPPLRGPPAPAGPPDYTRLRPTPITLRLAPPRRLPTSRSRTRLRHYRRYRRRYPSHRRRHWTTSHEQPPGNSRECPEASSSQAFSWRCCVACPMA